LAVYSVRDMIKLSEEENNYIEISSESVEEIVSLGSVAGTCKCDYKYCNM
jgi:hypothetical protein